MQPFEYPHVSRNYNFDISWHSAGLSAKRGQIFESMHVQHVISSLAQKAGQGPTLTVRSRGKSVISQPSAPPLKPRHDPMRRNSENPYNRGSGCMTILNLAD